MAIRVASDVVTCSVCGEPLNAKGDCLACLLRTALDESLVEDKPSVPLIFGDFKILRREDGSLWELGRGAMGVTYLAVDTVLRRKVALKIIEVPAVARASDAVRERFLREARAAAALRHPNVAAVYQFGGSPDGSHRYYAMELVEGETLESRVRRDGPLKPKLVLEIAIQVSRALMAASAHGLIHRDLKPGNIMLTNGDTAELEVKIIDFGLAKAIADAGSDMDITHGQFVGTPNFASPEQFESGPVDVRSDIYSLGATLWFALTGKPPFAGHRIEEIRRAQKSAALPIEQLKAARVSSRLRSLLKSMLASEPAARPGTQELAARLRRCSAHMTGVRRTGIALAAAAILVLGISAFFAFRSLVIHPAAAGSASNMPIPEKRIAVLPFDNLSNDREDAAFADGVQDDLLTKLAKIADLKVISRTSVMQYSGKRDTHEIGDALRVSHVLEGSVRKTGAWLHINAQLIDTRSDTHVWAEQYDRDLKDLFAIQSEIAQKVADRLHAKISTAEKVTIERPPTADLTAFDLYSRAKNFLLNIVAGSTGTRKENLLKAADLLNQAVAHDPTFFQAYCQLAWTHDLVYFDGFDRTPQRLALAEAAIQAASRLHPEAGEAHLARAWHLYWGYRDYDAALAQVERARPTLPNDSWVLQLTGFIRRRQGRWEESRQNLERALDLDPRNFNLLRQAAILYDDLRRYADQAAMLDRALALRPDDLELKIDRANVEADWKADTGPMHQLIDEIRAKEPGALPSVADYWLLCALAEHDPAAAVNALGALGENSIGTEKIKYGPRLMEGLVARMAKDDDKAHAAFTAARAEQEKLVRANPDDAGAVGILGLIDAGLGRKEEALREGWHAVQLLPVEKDARSGPAMIVCLARIAAWVDEKDLAFEMVARASRLPSSVSYGEIKLMPWWDPLRGEPRFEQIVASLAPNSISNPAIPEKSIAVLPFENLSNDREDASFADGVQDDLLTKLAEIADLKVISRTSVMQYRDRHNTREVGNALGVSHVLEGSVRKTGAWLHINAQLIDARTDAHVWAEEYDRDLKDIFSIQSEIAQKVAQQLHAKVSAAEKSAIERPPTADITAFDLYSRAKNLVLTWNSSSPEKRDLLEAATLLNQAVARDPTFFQGYCQLAWVDDQLYFFRFDRTSERLALAKAAIETAFRLHPDAGETHLARAENFYHGYLDYDRALAELDVARKTLANDPRVFELTGYIERRRPGGDQEKALRYLERALDLDPRNSILLRQIALSYDYLRRYREEEAILDRELAIRPNDVYLKGARAFVDLDWKADTRPLHELVDSIQATNPVALTDIADKWLTCALAERDAAAAADALAARGEKSLGNELVKYSPRFMEGLIARMAQDDAKARSAFTAARAEQEKLVGADPNDPGALSVLGLIDADLGRKEEALQEGRRAVELLPVEKDVLNGVRMTAGLARIAASVGDNELACEQLTRATSLPNAVVTFGQLKLLPWWDPLRGEPCFEQIVASLAPK
jgi:TolB-like protein/Tfp pilus assembly protein PilF